MSPYSGLLTVRGEGKEELNFVVEHRTILFLDSADSEEQLWKIMVENNFLEKSEVPPPNSNFQDCLMRFLINQAFSLEDLRKVHRRHLKSVLLEVGRWPDLYAEFYTGDVANDDIGGVFIGDVLLDMAREVLPYEEVKKEISTVRNLSRAQDFDQVLSNLTITPEESFIASRFEKDQSINVDELCMLTGFPEEKVARFVFVLTKMRAIQMKGEAARKPAVEKVDGPGPDYNVIIAEQFYQLAKQEFVQSHYWKVTELCKQAIRNDAARAKYYELMAMAYVHHPRFLDDAEQCFYKAIELEPKEPAYRVRVSKFLFNQGLVQRAVEECKKALEIDSEHEEALEWQEEMSQKPTE
jgi:tetratricopeptide (TPR) repeat protein